MESPESLNEIMKVKLSATPLRQALTPRTHVTAEVGKARANLMETVIGYTSQWGQVSVYIGDRLAPHVNSNSLELS